MHKVKAKGILSAANGMNITEDVNTDAFIVTHAVNAIR